MTNRETNYYLVDIDTIVPYINNARTHDEKQISQIAASIKEFGFLSPIIISGDNTILCGHGRYYAAQKLGLKKVPCIKEEYLTETQKKAYIIADNKLSLNAGWDNEMLAVELSELQGENFNLDLLGFDAVELSKIFDEGNDAKEDDFDVEEELKNPCFSKQGDIWKLGKHTVICGDSTDSNTFKKLLGDKKVNLVCTDAPYFVNLENQSGKIANDNLDDKSAYHYNLEESKRSEYLDDLKDLDDALEENVQKKKKLNVFFSKGFIDTVTFEHEKDRLKKEHEMISEEKNVIINLISGDDEKKNALKELISYTSKGDMISEYDEDLFIKFVDHIIVYSREEIGFAMKCGPIFRERID